jgi:lysophospholipid acyltransferase
MQTAGRLCRANIRPLVLAAVVSAEDGTKIAALPPPIMIKTVYDVVGSVLTLILINYTIMPFMLLGFMDSFRGWYLLHLYGHVVIGGALIFFYAGGKQWLKTLQTRRTAKAQKRFEELKNQQGPGATVASDSFLLPPVDLAVREFEAERKLD